MLHSAGFVEIGMEDRTEDYQATQAAWIEAMSRREAAIRPIVGDEAFDQRLRDRRRTLTAIEDGLLVRVMYWATRP